MKLKTSLKCLAGSVALVVAGTQSAYAAVGAQAWVQLSGFTISTATLSDEGGSIGDILDGGENGNITVGTVFNTTDVKAQLDGGVVEYSNNALKNTDVLPDGPNPGAVSNTGSTAMCVGDCSAVANNAYPILGAPTTNFVTADQNDEGSPAEGVINDAGDGTLDTPANVSIGAWAGLADIASDDATATGNNGLTSTFTLTLAEDTALAFQFGLSQYVEVFMGGDEQAGSAAQAQAGVSFTIKDSDGGVVFSTLFELIGFNQGQNTVTAPTSDGLDRTFVNQGMSVGSPLSASFFGDDDAIYTDILKAGEAYTLSAAMDARADINRVVVPVPATMLLLGLGLVGMGVMRKKKAV